MRFKLLIAVFLGVLVSCNQKPQEPDLSDFTPEAVEIVPTQTDKKMVKIDGGKYRAFIGKSRDSMVYVDSFEMDESAVTNAEFLEFLKKNPHYTKSRIMGLYADSTYLKTWPGDYELPKDVSPDAPVTNVSWYAAKAYAESVGKRLPTVDEWEYAARADETRKDATDDPKFTDLILKKYEQKGTYKNAVKQGAPNYWGLYDLYGVIWEWTLDFNSIMMSGESRSDTQPDENLFCAGAALTATDLRDYAAFMRFAMRGSVNAQYTIHNLGFRCARDL